MKLQLGLGALLVFAGLAAAQNGPYPRVTEWLDTTSTGTGLFPSIGSDGNLVVCAYCDGTSTGTQNVSVSITDGTGVAWSPPIRVDNDTAGFYKLTQFDSCKVSGNRVYVAWEDKRVGLNDNNLFFNYSTDGGNTWQSTDVQLDTNYGGTGQIMDWRFKMSPDVAGDHLYIVYGADDPPAGFLDEELWLVSSHDGGVTWNAPVLIFGQALAGVDVDNVGLCAEGNTVHVVWEDNWNGGAGEDIWYQKSTDGGATWMPAPIQLDLQTDPTHLGDVATAGTTGIWIECSGTLVVAIWHEERTHATNEELRVAISTDGGTTWGPDQKVGGYDETVDDVDTNALILSGNNIIIAHNDNRDPTLDDHIFINISTDFGVSWTEHWVSGPMGGSFPRLVGEGSDIGVTYTADVSVGGNQHVGFVASVDAGLTWLDEVEIGDVTLYDADFAEGGYNAQYRNFFSAFLSNEFSTNNVYASGICVNGIATVGARNGGTNPASYTASAPIIGGFIQADVDVASTGHSFGWIAGYAGPATFTLGGGQTGLVDPSSSGELLQLIPQPGPLAQWQISVPNDPAWCGFTVSTQAAHFGTVFPWVLSNSQDFVLGAYE